jgi:hypothetical protein
MQAVLSLDGTRLDVQLEVASQSTAALMEQERATLQEQLQAAGIEPGAIQVRHGK